ncbi:MAG: alcohol dehydrogenase catalytic domain-containing protein [Kiritimatiellae bacterium]|nr:alcohol dehydrogenase catalytic domain-containing protein [Kiritimatiellia bacterium]
MKILRLTGIRQLELQSAPLPELRTPRDVRIRITRVGVCGSDIHYYAEGRIGSQVVRYPFAVGHECAGVVDAVGPAVRGVRPGDRVAVEPAVSCGACDQCRCGRPNTCRALKFLGCPDQLEGCLAEMIVMPESNCLPLPPGADEDLGALSEPFAIAVYAVRQSGPMVGRRVAVLGAGPIGLSVILAARAEGAAVVYATDPVPERRAAARRAGAVWAGDPERDDPVGELARREPLGLDVVFECCGQQSAVDQALRMLGPGGTLSMIGIPSVERISLQIDLARRREIRFQNVRRQAHCAEPALQMLASGRVDARWMITHRYPLERAAEAFELVEGLRDGVLKAMIELDGQR